MRLAIVSDVHPDTPHISAVRLWAFARELSARGHQVVFITQQSNAMHSDMDAIACFDAKIAKHDWSKPLLCELRAPAGRITSSRVQGVSVILRRLDTAWNLFVRGGPRVLWSNTVAASSKKIAVAFRPDVVWTTFGHTSNLVAARKLARESSCPWVLDIKDNWELFVPKGLRRLMVWRTGGWAALTANAEFTRRLASKWQRSDAVVIYSGVDAAFLRNDGKIDAFSVNVIGGIYDRTKLREVLAGLSIWISSLSVEERAKVCVRYLGGDAGAFIEESRGVIEPQYLQVCGYVDITELARYCRTALANLYVRSETGFHHKLLELLACGRPAIAFPGESVESRLLAQRADGVLFEVACAQDVSDLLAKLAIDGSHPAQDASGRKSNSFLFTWPELACSLERVLVGVLARQR